MEPIWNIFTFMSIYSTIVFILEILNGKTNWASRENISYPWVVAIQV